MLRGLPFILISLLLAPILLCAEPAPFNLTFDVSRNGKALGEATLTLTRVNDETWLFRTHTVGTSGLASIAGVDIDERSEFKWVNGKPQTLRYQFDQKMRFRSRKRSMTVLPNAQRVSGQDNKGAFNLTYEPDLLDRNLVVLALATDVARGVKSAEYRIADNREIDSNNYEFFDAEPVTTGRGTISALRIERIRKKKGRQTTTWVAPSMDYLPIRIRQVEPNGETLDMVLR